MFVGNSRLTGGSIWKSTLGGSPVAVYRWDDFKVQVFGLNGSEHDLSAKEVHRLIRTGQPVRRPQEVAGLLQRLLHHRRYERCE